MGERGPVPRREDSLARPRSRRGSDEQAVTKGVARAVTWPEPDESWHAIATMLWNAVKDSGQSDFYQQSDVALLYSLCDDLSFYKSATFASGDPKRSPEMLKALNALMERLLIAEGDRRRVRIELVEPETDKTPASVVAIADYKRELDLEEDE